MAADSPGLEVSQLTKRFHTFKAVDGVSFHVRAGSIFGLIGPNGAGKTTAIRIIMGILGADGGEVRYQGRIVSRSDSRRFGYLPEERGLYQKTKLGETLAYLAELKGVDRATAHTRVAAYLARFDLADYSKKPIQTLSKGNQQKVQFIAAVLHQPVLAILDEPFTGLDPVNQIVLREIIGELQAQGTTILLSTHQMEQVERMCDRICLINNGQVIVEGDLAEIKARFGTTALEVTFSETAPLGLDKWLEVLETNDATVVGVPRHDQAQTLKGLMALGEVVAFNRREPSLEQIFIAAVRGTTS